MTGILIGLNLKYLPWQLAALIMFGASIVCVYGAVTIKKKSKVINIILICGAIMIFLTGIKSMAINIGAFAPYLPFFNPIIYSTFGITMILIFFFL